MNIVVFGAGGRIGRRIVAEAQRRGHQVTAVVRDPANDGELAGDVTDAASVAQAAIGADAVVSAAADLSAAPHDFFTASSRALDAGLTKAGVRRLVVVGLASVMAGRCGTALMDEPGYPNEYRSFYLGHAAGLDQLRNSELGWVYLTPAGDFDHDAPSTGGYQLATHADATSRITPADFALALLDEIETPHHHRAAASVRAAA